jgi:hypothetical protein
MLEKLCRLLYPAPRMAKELTIREAAERLGVARSSLRVWLVKKPPRFPNARKVETLRGPVWVIPLRDLRGFKVKPRGRPAKPKKGKDKHNA